MRVNRWELNRGYRGKSSGRNDLRLIECVLRVFGNLGRRSDPESSILTIFAATALAMSTNAGTDTTGLHLAAQKKQKAVSS